MVARNLLPCLPACPLSGSPGESEITPFVKTLNVSPSTEAVSLHNIATCRTQPPTTSI